MVEQERSQDGSLGHTSPCLELLMSASLQLTVLSQKFQWRNVVDTESLWTFKRAQCSWILTRSENIFVLKSKNMAPAPPQFINFTLSTCLLTQKPAVNFTWTHLDYTWSPSGLHLFFKQDFFKALTHLWFSLWSFLLSTFGREMSHDCSHEVSHSQNNFHISSQLEASVPSLFVWIFI